ncbi:MAG: DUF4912 domain-containing protein [Pirellulales bacterium]
MAKKDGVSGWHAMRKEDLIRALVRTARSQSRRKTGSSNVQRSSREVVPVHRREKPKHIKRFQSAQRLLKLLSNDQDGRRSSSRDRLVAMVRGPFWLQVSWELKSKSVQRAAAALGEHWHTARPVLRLLAVPETGTVERAVRVIDIHGGVNTWYVDVSDPPGKFRAEIGYMATDERFHAIARSNVVATPPPSSYDELDQNWKDVAENCDKIYAMSGGDNPNGSAGELRELFEERLRRPMGTPLVTRFGNGAESLGRCRKKMDFNVEAELIVYGLTSPDSHLTFRGEPIEMREDGTFTVRMAFPDKRQVIPVVATSKNGVEQQTIILAVERNTKVMEPLIREPDSDKND